MIGRSSSRLTAQPTKDLVWTLTMARRCILGLYCSSEVSTQNSDGTDLQGVLATVGNAQAFVRDGSSKWIHRERSLALALAVAMAALKPEAEWNCDCFGSEEHLCLGTLLQIAKW